MNLRTFNMNKAFCKITALLVALLMVVFPCLYISAEESSSSDLDGGTSGEASEPNGEESEAEDTFILTVITPFAGTYTVNGGIEGTTSGIRTAYTLTGVNSASVSISYDGDYDIGGVYLEDEYIASSDGSTVSFELESNKTLAFDIKDHPTVNCELEYTGLTASDVTLKINGAKMSQGVFPKGAKTVVTPVLLGGLQANKIVLKKSDGTEIKTVMPQDNSFALPAMEEDFILELVVLDSDTFLISTESEGEGTVEASPKGETKKGTSVTFTATPNDGYYVKSATLNGKPIMMTGNTYTTSAYSDLTLKVVFAEIPDTIKITLSVDEKASNGSIAFESYEGASADIPFGEEFTVVFTPNEGYAVDRVYINGIFTVPKDNKLTLKADGEYEIVVAFKKATYIITAMVPYGGTIEAVGYTLNGGMITVDHGASVTFRYTADMGHVLASVKIDGVAITEDTPQSEYTFTNVTQNHTISVSFVAEGEDIVLYSINVDCGPHGSVLPSTRIDIDDGGDVVISFVPDDGYVVDKVLLDGNQVTLTQGKLVLIGVTSDHIVKVTFKESSASSAAWITADDVNWTPNEVVIDISQNLKVGMDVFQKINSLTNSKKFVFRTELVDVTLPQNIIMLIDPVSSDYVELSYSTVIDPNLSGVFNRCLAENGITSLYTVVTLPSTFPPDSAVTFKLGSTFALKTVNVFEFDGTCMTNIKSGETVSSNGSLSVLLKDVNTLVVAVDPNAPEKHTVNVVCQSNGTCDPMGTQIVEHGGSLEIKIFPFDGFAVDTITVNGKALLLDEDAKQNGVCTLPLTNIQENTEVDITFAPMPESDKMATVLIIIIIVSIALVGGGGLFFLQWKQIRY